MAHKRKAKHKGPQADIYKGIAPAPNKNKENWTVMIYLAGDNNLSEEMVFALKSMFDMGSPNDHTHIVALYDSIGALVPFDIPVVKHTGQTGGRKAASGEQPLPVTQDHDLMDKQEAFLDKLAKFIRSGGTKVDREFAALQSAEALLIGSVEDPEAPHIARKLDATQTALIAEKEAEETQYPELRRLRMAGGTTLEILVAFIIDSIKLYPAQHYALILSGHGSGAVGDFLTSNKQISSLSIQSVSDALKLVALSDALEQARKGKRSSEPWLDLLGFDSCLMSMAEVAYEVRDCVQFMVGSEGFETATGWPYDRVLALLHRKPDISAEAFARGIVDEHIAYYDDYTTADVSVDLSAMNLEKLRYLVDALGYKSGGSDQSDAGLAVLMENWLHGLQNRAVHDPIRDAIILAHWEAQGYKDEQYTDLWDFCASLSKRTSVIAQQASFAGYKVAEDISKACGRVQEMVSQLAFRSRFRGAAFQHSHGVSIFFPWADLKDAAGTSELDHYAQLAFAKDSHWDEFLAEYFTKTIRESRDKNGKPAQQGRLHHSFLNLRPFVYTGEPEEGLFVDKPAGEAPAANSTSLFTLPMSQSAMRTSPFTPRTSPFTPRTSPFTPRTSPFTPRTSPFTPRTSPFTPRTSPFTPRTSPFTPRTSPFTPRNVGLEPPKISGMKNPAIDWIEFD